MGKKIKKRIVLLCYLAFLAVWLLRGVFFFAWDRMQTPKTLPLEEGVAEGAAFTEDGIFLTEDGDPKLVFSSVNATVRRVVVHAEYEQEPGELDLYYARKEGQGFSPAKRVGARQVTPGIYEYTLPPGQATALRIDLGTVAGNRVAIREIQLNPQAGFGSYFPLTLGTVAALGLLPALASCLIYIIIDTLQLLRRRGGRHKGSAANGE